MKDQDALKKMAADAAVEYVKDGQVVGLGTGSTFKHVVAKLAERVKAGLRITGVPTSLETARLAREAGIPLLAEDGEWAVDVALDGADQVDPQLNLIKGGGGALLKEKIVASAAAKFVVIVDETKRVPVLGGSFPLPVEVVRFGWGTVMKKLETFGCRAAPRMKDGGLFVTEAGHLILDLSFPKIADPGRLEADLEKTPGVVCTGLFVGRTDVVIVATQQGIVTLNRPGARP
ncbi:MAG: ribose-5-phosphate isomerase RpiA [Nitrospirae bacterium]|nr:MAG: ribose-5-phosphate isomerase RpiA [Nitrospirota bacterium]